MLKNQGFEIYAKNRFYELGLESWIQDLKRVIDSVWDILSDRIDYIHRTIDEKTFSSLEDFKERLIVIIWSAIWGKNTWVSKKILAPEWEKQELWEFDEKITSEIKKYFIEQNNLIEGTVPYGIIVYFLDHPNQDVSRETLKQDRDFQTDSLINSQNFKGAVERFNNAIEWSWFSCDIQIVSWTLEKSYRLVWTENNEEVPRGSSNQWDSLSTWPEEHYEDLYNKLWIKNYESLFIKDSTNRSVYQKILSWKQDDYSADDLMWDIKSPFTQVKNSINSILKGNNTWQEIVESRKEGRKKFWKIIQKNWENSHEERTTISDEWNIIEVWKNTWQESHNIKDDFIVSWNFLWLTEEDFEDLIFWQIFDQVKNIYKELKFDMDQLIFISLLKFSEWAGLNYFEKSIVWEQSSTDSIEIFLNLIKFINTSFREYWLEETVVYEEWMFTLLLEWNHEMFSDWNNVDTTTWKKGEKINKRFITDEIIDHTEELRRNSLARKLYRILIQTENIERTYSEEDIVRITSQTTSAKSTVGSLNRQLSTIRSLQRFQKNDNGLYQLVLGQSWKSNNSALWKTVEMRRNGYCFEFHIHEWRRTLTINWNAYQNIRELYFLVMQKCVTSTVCGFTLPEKFLEYPEKILEMINYFIKEDLPFEISDNIVHIR